LQAALHRAAGMIEPREEKRDNATSQRDFSSLVLVLVNFNEIERARARARKVEFTYENRLGNGR